MKIKKTPIIILFISSLIFALCEYINKQYFNVGFEQILFTFLYSKDTSLAVILEGVRELILPFLINFIFLITPVIIFSTYDLIISIRKLSIKIKFYPIIYSLLCFVILSFISVKKIGLIEYISYQLKPTNLYEEYYVDPGSVDISFSEKRNLIHIYLESMETTYFSSENGGTYGSSLVPELEQLAKDNLNFSNSDKLGGFIQLPGTTWTIAAMVSQSAGLPLKVISDGNSYGSNKSFLPGIVSIGDILEKNGYNQALMIGSSALFGGREYFYKLHGNYDILDYNWALESKIIPSDYKEWWVYEDKKLFEFAKDKLLELSENDEPFNFTMLTADTHFPDGYVDYSCESKYNDNYSNSFACSSKMVLEFVNWIKEQSFYENTTIVISGDHLGMQDDFYSNISPNYTRTVYNAFINTKKTDNNKNRLFSSFDMYPTILHSIGANIKGEKLGFGVNLFSDEKTLLEEIGYEFFQEELKKKTYYYDKYIIKNSYKDMSEQ